MSNQTSKLKMTAMERQHLRSGLLFCLPGIVGLMMFTVYPVLASLYYSFCNYSVLKPPHWVGWGNYQVLMHDSQLGAALKNTVIYAAMAIPSGIITAFLLANLLNQKVRGMAFFRTAFYLPSVTPAVASAVLWVWVLNPQFGLLNTALASVGIQGPGWLSDPAWAKAALALMGMWGVGSWMVIFLAGLQDVPVELQEAARLDGAGSYASWRHVTLPFMSPHLLFASVMGLIGVSSFFAQPMVMTGGGPAGSTTFFAQYLFQNAFQFFKMGYACALAWSLAVVLIFLTALLFRGSTRYVYYGGD
ncbi:MAG: sugar ABC transporter permease [Abitibacteriaceae bacterium]|nr:sugar ABC transporter permease [Abditibacteriaceae bacterium]